MTLQNLPFAPASQRLTLVYGAAPVAGEGPSLQEIDSDGLPDGAIVYCVYKNAFYRLKKTSTTAIDTTSTFNNVVAASGGGRWVRTLQMAYAALTGGTTTFTNMFDMTGGLSMFVVSLITPGGTPGYLHATKTSETVATATSTSGSDTSVVLVQVYQGNLVA